MEDFFVGADASGCIHTRVALFYGEDGVAVGGDDGAVVGDDDDGGVGTAFG